MKVGVTCSTSHVFNRNLNKQAWLIFKAKCFQRSHEAEELIRSGQQSRRLPRRLVLKPYFTKDNNYHRTHLLVKEIIWYLFIYEFSNFRKGFKDMY